MQTLLEQINEVEKLITRYHIKSISFDIDGTLFPIRHLYRNWFAALAKCPLKTMRFYKISRTLEYYRKLNTAVDISSRDLSFFKKYLIEILFENISVEQKLVNWIAELEQRNLKVIYLSDHATTAKLQSLNLASKNTIDCLFQTGHLKPHASIISLLVSQNIHMEHHLHLGDRSTDEEQAKLFGCRFKLFKM